MSETIRVTFDEETLDEMRELAPAAVQDPEVIRMFCSLGKLFVDARIEGLEGGAAELAQAIAEADVEDENADE